MLGGPRGSKAHRLFLAGLLAGAAIAAATAPSALAGEIGPRAAIVRSISFPGPCALLPMYLPELANGSVSPSTPFQPPWADLPHPGNVTLPPVNESPNATVGEFRTLWNATCTSPLFIETAGNLSRSAFSAGGSGNVRTGNISVEPMFLWSADCTGNTASFGNWYVSRPVSPPPAYTGSGCSYTEYWSDNVFGNGSANVTGPFLEEGLTANLPHSSLPYGPGGSGGSDGLIFLAWIVGPLAAATVVAILVARREWSASLRAATHSSEGGDSTPATEPLSSTDRDSDLELAGRAPRMPGDPPE